MRDYLQQYDLMPVLAFGIAVFNYLICPDHAYLNTVTGLWVAVILDILTRLYAQTVKAGGLFRAIRTRRIMSETLWRGTAVKVVSYLCLQILAGLAMKITQFQVVNMAMVTVIYSFLFLREAISVVENLDDAGAHYLRPLLNWLRRKQDDITGDEPAERPEK